MLDAFEYTVAICENVVVPKPQNCEAGLLEELSALRVKCSRMLAAVEFHDQLSLKAYEVQNVIGKRVLPPELAIFNLPAAQTLPKSVLGIRRCTTQSTLQFWFENALVRLTFHSSPSRAINTIPTQPSP